MRRLARRIAAIIPLLFVSVLAFAAPRAGSQAQSAAPAIDFSGHVSPYPGNVRDIERETLAAINRIREKAGLPGLEFSDAVASVARQHSEEMASKKFFNHRSSDGALNIDRLRRAGITSWVQAGENLVKVHGFLNVVQTATEEWMNSEGHRHNILDRVFKRSGAGAAIDENGTVYLTQIFLAP